MSYFYSILYIAILSTSVFAMDRKEAANRSNQGYESYNSRSEIYEQTIAPNKTVADIPSDSKSAQKK